jgi:hypothetical protein
MSTRVRQPEGKTNIMSARLTKTNSNKKLLADTFTLSPQRINDHVSNTARERLNDPLHVHKADFSRKKAEERTIPVMPKSRFSTLPSPREPLRRTRPLTCPASWIEHNQEKSWYETQGAEFYTNMDYGRKMAYLKPFMDRNRDRLRSLDSGFYDEGENQIEQEIIDSDNFIARIKQLEDRELTYLRLKSSEQMNKCLDDVFLGTRPLREPCFDPFKVSMNTTRIDRELEYTRTIAPAFQEPSKFKRGFCHAIGSEYGNFSRYNSCLKSNEAATLKR